MTAKEYLSQARYLDMRINAKLEQLESLNQLATKATSVLTGMPRNPSASTSTMADAVVKIVALQHEINQDIDNLVDTKQAITKTIKSIQDVELQTILEKRYLCFFPWEQIATSMNYDMRWLYRLHGKALDEVQALIDKTSH